MWPPPRSSGRPGAVCQFEEAAGSGPAATIAAAGRHDARPGFHWLVLQRHGRRPLAVLSRALLRADNRCAGVPCWSEIAIHETEAGRFAATLCHTPPAQYGPAWRDAFLCDDAAGIRAAFRAHDPLCAYPLSWRDDAATSEPWMSGSSSPDPGASPDLSAFDALCLPDPVAVRRFRAAWGGLLAAVCGVRGELPAA